MAVLSSRFESPEQRSYQTYFIVAAVFLERKKVIHLGPPRRSLKYL